MQAGNAGGLIKYRPADDDVGPFNAYRGAEEVLGGWRERVFGDISYGEEQLAHHVEGYRPLAFAPPYGNYGQAGTNDPRIPRELLPRLLLSFAVVFTQDRSGFAKAGASNPFGRIDVTPDVDAAGLRALLAPEEALGPAFAGFSGRVDDPPRQAVPRHSAPRPTRRRDTGQPFGPLGVGLARDRRPLKALRRPARTQASASWMRERPASPWDARRSSRSTGRRLRCRCR